MFSKDIHDENKWANESEIAIKAITNCQNIIRYKSQNISYSNKESIRDIVTKFDIKADKDICGFLQKNSNYAVLSEESSHFTNNEKLLDSSCWIVDSIDGTVNFSRDIPFYGTSIGLYIEEKFVVGAVLIHPLNELFFTNGNHGAYLNGKILNNKKDTNLASSLVAISFSGVRGDANFRHSQFKLFEKINDSSHGCLRLGAASVNICYVASGRLQAACGIHNQIWDVAGSLSIARLSGCKILFSRIPNSTKINYIVGTPTVVDEIADLMYQQNLCSFNHNYTVSLK